MREIVAILLLLMLFFPQSAGVAAHKAFKDFKIGWDQVQP